MILPVNPHKAVLGYLDTAIDSTTSAVVALTKPGFGVDEPHIMMIVDPREGALTHGKAALDAIDGALEVSRDSHRGTPIDQAAIAAMTSARSEILQGNVTIENGHPSIAPAVTHFHSTLNWLNTARNLVTHQNVLFSPAA